MEARLESTQLRTEALPSEHRPLYRHADLAWILLSLLPYALVFVVHFSMAPHSATGFLQYDVPYYLANAREVFERGNGLTYPNPYDPASDSPAIYFHWSFVLLGYAVSELELDPSRVLIVCHALAAVAMAATTLILIRATLPHSRRQRLYFLLAMWGGGLFCLAKILSNLALHESAFNDLLAWDPGQGAWGLNWGRNAMLPTEALYHALTAASWSSFLIGRNYWGVVLAGLLAATHPWSGIEILLTVNGYLLVSTLLSENKRPVIPLLLAIMSLLAFLTYYFVYLPRFEVHRILHEQWTLNWGIDIDTMLLAWGLVAFVAVARLMTRRMSLSHKELFLGIAFCVAFGLSIHDRFITPRQPIHFTRGYVWMPLLLLALPWLDACWDKLRQRTSKPQSNLVVAALFCVMVFDNSCFVMHQIRNSSTERGVGRLDAETKAMWDWMTKHGIDGVLIADDPLLMYLAATYTPARPYYGHKYNTPEITKRREQVDRFLALPTSENLEHIDWIDETRPTLLLLSPSEKPTPDQENDRTLAAGLALESLYSVGNLSLYRLELPPDE